MHPDLYYVLHQQRERELDAELRRRLAVRERAVPPKPRRGLLDAPARLVSALRPVHRTRVGTPVVCCAPA